jgi:pSer/pThr/pTyr-binding forkhead associated (FHA) protein
MEVDSIDVAPGSLFTARPPRLVMLVGPTPGAELPLLRPRTVVGRGEDVDIAIDHTSVSRRHCEIVAIQGGRFEVFDSGSANGILWNGTQLPRAILEGGDILTLGDVSLRFVPEGQVLRNTLRDIDPVPRRRRRFAWYDAIPYLLFVLVVAIGGYFAWRFARR